MKHEISIDADKPHFLIEDEMNSLFAFDPKREMGQQFYDRERLGLIYPMSMGEYEDALFMLNDDLGKFDHPEVDIPWVNQALLALWGVCSSLRLQLEFRSRNSSPSYATARCSWKLAKRTLTEPRVQWGCSSEHPHLPRAE